MLLPLLFKVAAQFLLKDYLLINKSNEIKEKDCDFHKSSSRGKKVCSFFFYYVLIAIYHLYIINHGFFLIIFKKIKKLSYDYSRIL